MSGLLSPQMPSQDMMIKQQPHQDLDTDINTATANSESNNNNKTKKAGKSKSKLFANLRLFQPSVDGESKTSTLKKLFTIADNNDDSDEVGDGEKRSTKNIMTENEDNTDKALVAKKRTGLQVDTNLITRLNRDSLRVLSASAADNASPSKRLSHALSKNNTNTLQQIPTSVYDIDDAADSIYDVVNAYSQDILDTTPILHGRVPTAVTAIDESAPLSASGCTDISTLCAISDRANSISGSSTTSSSFLYPNSFSSRSTGGTNAYQKSSSYRRSQILDQIPELDVNSPPSSHNESRRPSAVQRLHSIEQQLIEAQQEFAEDEDSFVQEKSQPSSNANANAADDDDTVTSSPPKKRKWLALRNNMKDVRLVKNVGRSQTFKVYQSPLVGMKRSMSSELDQTQLDKASANVLDYPSYKSEGNENNASMGANGGGGGGAYYERAAVNLVASISAKYAQDDFKLDQEFESKYVQAQRDIKRRGSSTIQKYRHQTRVNIECHVEVHGQTTIVMTSVRRSAFTNINPESDILTKRILQLIMENGCGLNTDESATYRVLCQKRRSQHGPLMDKVFADVETDQDILNVIAKSHNLMLKVILTNE
ncbi:hypothetical protein MIR68_010912 [Amoeboaphelidium protococcarum]|nr:hypothetical protein MIR68_010912 [Amoeboaphelidium protococcarum]